MDRTAEAYPKLNKLPLGLAVGDSIGDVSARVAPLVAVAGLLVGVEEFTLPKAVDKGSCVR
jgi:hypothetical protein